MKNLWLVLFLLLLGGLSGLPLDSVHAQSVDQPVVHAVLFYSPTCPHCHKVIEETLIPMLNQYGDRLQIAGIDITQPGGQALYQASTERFQVPQELSGVPRLIVGETVLVGSLQIPQEFPGIVEKGLAAGGIPWPDIPGWAEVVAAAEQQEAAATATVPASAGIGETAEATPTSTPASTPTPTAQPVALPVDALPPAEPAAGMPEGGWLAAAVLGGMLLALAFAVLRLLRVKQPHFAAVHSWLIPALCLAGLGVAAYLAFVEITHTEAVCGPVGECNAVQTSPYAQILGIPVAVLGLINYAAVLVLWATGRFGAARWAGPAGRGLLYLTVFGVLFSIYLTLLEIFVIHAICAWCLTSAVIATALMVTVVMQVTQVDTAAQTASANLPLNA